MEKRPITMAVAGGFDPLNGRNHLAQIQLARQLGDRLVVILARDDQMANKKGLPFYLYYEDREAIMKELRAVDEAVDRDMTRAETLRLLKPDIFAKGRRPRSGGHAGERVEGLPGTLHTASLRRRPHETDIEPDTGPAPV